MCVYNDAAVPVLWTVELKVSCLAQDPLSDVIAAFTPDRDRKFTPRVVVLDQVYIARDCMLKGLLMGCSVSI